MMDVVDLMHALESAWDSAYPGRESIARDHVLRELRQLLEHEPHQNAPIRVRLMIREN
jgi:hypothetical protein